MKKSLSILLSLLMVLGCMTCLFTMPTMAVEAATETTTESMPINCIDVANSDSTWLRMFPVSGDNNALGITYIQHSKPYQLEFTVTTDADLPANVKLYADFYQEDETTLGAYYASGIVGVRYDPSTPGAVETAHNHQTSGSLTTGTSATLAAGKTYRYVYTFVAQGSNTKRFKLSYAGGEDHITISDPYLGCLKNTQCDDFYYEPAKVVRFLAEENGNVFQRFYGYRTIAESIAGTKALGTYIVSAHNTGKLYNMLFKANKTYTVDYKLRLPTGSQITGSDNRFPGINIFETSTGTSTAIDRTATGGVDSRNHNLLYADAFIAAFNDIDATWLAANKTYLDSVGTHGGYVTWDGALARQQTICAENYNAYSYNWSSGANILRRPQKTGTLSSLDYYQNGAKVANATSISSAAGRGLATALFYNSNLNNWVDATYRLNTISGQKPLDGNDYTADDVKEAQLFGAANTESAAYIRYYYDAASNSWKTRNDYRCIVAPTNDDAYCGVAIENVGKGYTYDFDDFSVKGQNNVEIEYLDKNGAATEISANDNSVKATAYGDLSTNTFTLSVTGFEGKDALTFLGWEKDGVIVSTEPTLSITQDDYNNLPYKAKITYYNLMSKSAGYETAVSNRTDNYYKYSTKVDNYPFDSTDDGVDNPTQPRNATVFTQAPDDGEKWGYITGGDRLGNTHPYDAENHPFLHPSGNWGDGNSMGFGSIKDSLTFVDTNGATQTVTPHTGTGALLFWRLGGKEPVKALTGLTKGQSYRVSFYTYAPTTNDYVKYAYVANHYMGVINNTLGAVNATNAYQGKAVDLGQTVLSTNTTANTPENTGKWIRQEVVFTATKETEYLHLTIQGDYTKNSLNTGANVCFADDFCMQEVYRNETEWTFEDGKTTDINTTSTSTYQVVDAVDQPEKIGTKYLNYTTSGATGGLTFNFNYNSTDRYYITFDMIVKARTPYLRGIDLRLEPANDGKIEATNQTKPETTALNNPKYNTIRRWAEDGTKLNQVTTFNQEIYSDYLANNGATMYRGGGQYYGQNSDGSFAYFDSAWNKWQHFEIEVDPKGNDYVGDVEFTILANQAGWEIGVDNFKVIKRDIAPIKEIDDATVGTSLYNIRPASYRVNQGLRFKSTIDISTRNATLSEGAKIVEYGTLAMNGSLYKNSNNALVYDMVGTNVVAGKAYVENEEDLQYTNDGTKITYTGVLTNIGLSNFKVMWAVRGYVVFENTDGSREVVYDDVVMLSVYDAAKNIVDTVATDHPDYAAAKAVVDAYDEAYPA